MSTTGTELTLEQKRATDLQYDKNNKKGSVLSSSLFFPKPSPKDGLIADKSQSPAKIEGSITQKAEMLWKSIESGTPRETAKLLDKFSPEELSSILTTLDQNGRNCLHLALRKKSVELTSLFLAAYQKVNKLEDVLMQKDKDGNTPLDIAAKHCSDVIIKNILLVIFKNNLLEPFKFLTEKFQNRWFSFDLFEFTVKFANISAVDYLLKLDAYKHSDKRKMLMIAAKRGDVAVFARLFEEVNAIWQQQYNEKYKSLISAVFSREIEHQCKFLNICPHGDDNLFLLAAENGHLDIIQFIITRLSRHDGSILLHKNEDDAVPVPNLGQLGITKAIEHGQDDVAAFLIDSMQIYGNEIYDNQTYFKDWCNLAIEKCLAKTLYTLAYSGFCPTRTHKNSNSHFFKFIDQLSKNNLSPEYEALLWKLERYRLEEGLESQRMFYSTFLAHAKRTDKVDEFISNISQILSKIKGKINPQLGKIFQEVNFSSQIGSPDDKKRTETTSQPTTPSKDYMHEITLAYLEGDILADKNSLLETKSKP